MVETKKMLVIEDDALLIEGLTREFSTHGFEVRTALDGDMGFDTARDMKPDIILLDIALPRVNGVEFLKRLNADPKLATIPVIVLTNMDNSANLAEILELGKYDYLLKAEWSLADVREKVNQKIALAHT